MSATEMKNFKAQLALLSYAEQLSLMTYLQKLLQQHEAENDNFYGEPNEATLVAADEIREQVVSHTHGTKDLDAFFAELDD